MSLAHDQRHATSTTPLPPPPRRRTSTRSPSPKVSFTPTQIFAASTPPGQGKGVQNITRQVIRRLSSLQHVEVVEMELENEQDGDGDETPSVNGTPVSGSPPREKVGTNGVAVRGRSVGNGVGDKGKEAVKVGNGVGSLGKVEVKKVDWEIPRKALHSSIGFFTIYLYTSQSTPRMVILVLWTALAVIVPADILRLRYPAFERVYERFLGFLMRESEKKSVNGVVWYILGVNFALSAYPLDVATVAILILSWADTAASTFGRLFGRLTPPLPRRTPVLRLPLAPRKSLAGFVAATVTGACIAVGFWGWVAPLRNDPGDVSWTWGAGVKGVGSSMMRGLFAGLVGDVGGRAGGWLGLGAIGIVAGLVSGVAEALDLGSLDDNLTLPIIAGGCILGFFKLLGLFS